MLSHFVLKWNKMNIYVVLFIDRLQCLWRWQCLTHYRLIGFTLLKRGIVIHNGKLAGKKWKNKEGKVE